MNSSNVIGLLNDIENRYPVAEWRINGIRVWPILRGRIYTVIVFYYLRSPENREQQRLGLVKRAIALPQNLASLAVACVIDAAKTRLRYRRADILILSDGTSFSKINGTWYDRIMGPLESRFAARGLSSFILSPGWLSLVPRYSPSMFIQSKLEWLKISASLLDRASSSVRDRHTEGLEDMLDELRAADFGAVIPPTGWIDTQTVRITRMARYFMNVLKKVRPRLAFVNTYYSAEGHAFCLACRQAGVPIADVQHGSQGNDHQAYGRWSAIPPGGYELMPDRFWCWGPDEANAIAQWCAGTCQAACIVGNMWMDIWRTQSQDFVLPQITAAHQLREGAQAGAHILITLSWGFDDEEVIRIFRAAAALQHSNYFWWIRLHPVQAGQERHFANLARTAGLCNFDIETATSLSLYAVFSAVDLHVTTGSTTVMEALEWGLRSVVTSAYGVDLCKEQIRSGAATAALTEDAIIQAIKHGVGLGRLPNAEHPQSAGHDALDSAIDEFLALNPAL